MFREYDIRGRETDDELNIRSAHLIGRAYAAYLLRRGITVAVAGHDNRATSEQMHAAIVDAMVGSGLRVFDVGLAMTPMVYWTQYHLRDGEGIDARGAAVVTASHNPAGWNGVKLGTGYSATMRQDDLKELLSIIHDEAFAEGTGSVETREIFPAYVEDLAARIAGNGPARALRVVVNTGNGTAGAFAPAVLRAARFEVIEHYTELDPTYPHYTPNPAEVEMMEDTGRVVRAHGADVGIAIDADGDRLGVTDERGETIWPDRFMILLARQVLESHPGSKIIFDVKCSNALPEDIVAHGGVPVMWKTGHSYIKEKIKSEDASFGGEMSGHLFFVTDYLGFDDATFAALKLLEYLSRTEEPLSRVIAGTPYYVSTPTYSVEVQDAEGKRADVRKYEIVAELTRHFKGKYADVVDINGARVTKEDGSWGLVRASSNLPTLVLRFESKTEAGLAAIEGEFRGELSKFPGVSSEWQTG
jgi:phosphomannomutase/phosphoglucomutase